MVKRLQRIGNSKGIVIPSSMLRACGMEGQVELTLVGKIIVLKSIERQPREGWEEQFQKAKANGDTPDSDFFEGMANVFDSSDWK